jgi:hypothetical protein
MNQSAITRALQEISGQLVSLTPDDRRLVLRTLSYVFCDDCGHINGPVDVAKLSISRTVCRHPERIQPPAGIREEMLFDEERRDDEKRFAVQLARFL